MNKVKLTPKEVGRLRRAINEFNKEVKSHYKDIDEKALPTLKNYKDVRLSITTERDYELTVRTLEKIKNKNAFKLISSEENPNVQFTNWEYQTAKRYDTRNRQRFKKELAKITPKAEKTGFGKRRVELLKTYLEESNVDMLKQSRDYTRARELLERIEKRGLDTFEYEMAETYKRNYLEMLKDYKNLDGYGELVEAIEKTSGEDFYKAILKTEQSEDYKDIQYMYDIKYAQAEFDKFKESLLNKINK